MECSICYNEITSATGKVELSCSHPFHFSCLTTWFDKQNIQGMHANCPICRHEANDFEKMPASIHDEEEDYDDDDDDDESTIEEVAAQERARNLFDKLKAINPIEEVQLYAANKIKACWRGYQDRLIYADFLEVKEDAEYHARMIEKNTKALLHTKARQKFLKSIIGLSRSQVKNLAATKIQSVVRMCNLKKIMNDTTRRVILPVGVWKKVGVSRWEKVIMNPEEDIPCTIQVHPLTSVHQL